MSVDRPPSEAEMRDAGVRLGLLAVGESVPASLRTKLAKVVRLAKEEQQQEQRQAAESDSVAAPLIDLHRALVDGGMPIESVGRIVAAIAPHVWRSHHQ